MRDKYNILPLKLISIVGYIGFAVFLFFLLWIMPNMFELDKNNIDGGFEYILIIGRYFLYYYITHCLLVTVLSVCFIINFIMFRNTKKRKNFLYLILNQSKIFILGEILAFLPFGLFVIYTGLPF